MKKYMNPEMKISKFSSEFVGTTENPDPLAPVTESSFTTGATEAYTIITGGGSTTNAMQKSVNFQDALGYK